MRLCHHCHAHVPNMTKCTYLGTWAMSGSHSEASCALLEQLVEDEALALPCTTADGHDTNRALDLCIHPVCLLVCVRTSLFKLKSGHAGTSSQACARRNKASCIIMNAVSSMYGLLACIPTDRVSNLK